ncbi:MAG TPA: hypothetical protein VLR88_06390 [Propionibacteriaceae bacterium]|nr:hypothetical protein [Propionibacteriaceae bacterium]
MSESAATGDRSARWSALRVPSTADVPGLTLPSDRPEATAPIITLPGGSGVDEFPRLPPSLIWAGRVSTGGHAMQMQGRPAGSWSVWGGADHDHQRREPSLRLRPPVRPDVATDGRAGARASREPFVVFAGRPWPTDQDCRAARLVAVFASFEDAQKAFSHVTFRRLPALDGRERWRGSAPFGDDIVQIEHRISQGAETQMRS